MPEQIENSMVVDSLWEELEKASEVEEVLKQKGYHEMGTNVFVPEDEAFDYALDRCLRGSELDQIEFRHMLVEWFYSDDNWIKEE